MLLLINYYLLRFRRFQHVASIFILLGILPVCGYGQNPEKEIRGDADELQIIDISQKQLALYNQHLATDSVKRVKIFRDSLYYPYRDVWDGYLGSMKTFDAVAEYYGIRMIEKLNSKNRLFYSDKKAGELLSAFNKVKEGMIELTGYSPRGKWYLLYGAAQVNLGGVGDGVMFVDLSFPGNTDLPSVINWFPHELNHQIFDHTNKDTATNVLELCINEGLAVYVNKLYWNRFGGKEDYSLAQSLSYTEKEMEAVGENWDYILDYFKNNYLSTDQKVKDSFGSRSVKLKPELPGAIGYIIGYRIVESYVEINGSGSWKDIYITGFEEVLDRSGFLMQ